jgi:hypothetical protein
MSYYGGRTFFSYLLTPRCIDPTFLPPVISETPLSLHGCQAFFSAPPYSRRQGRYGAVRILRPNALVCQTVNMTSQPNPQTNRPHREDYEVQKLIERIEAKLALQAKTTREAIQISLKN